MSIAERRKFLEWAGIGVGSALLLGMNECEERPAATGTIGSTAAALNETGNFDVYNVRDFGAVGNGAHDDTSAIQSAIDTAWSERGGIIYFPPGEYITTSSLIIRRGRSDLPNGGAKYVGLRFRGAGMQSSAIHATMPAAAWSSPVMTFDPTQESQSSSHYAFEDLAVGRDNDGYVLVHGQNNAGTTRLSYTTFRNVSFTCVHQAGQEPTQAAAVFIQGGFHLTFDNVLVSGGESALRIMNSSHVVMHTISTPVDWGTAGGVRIQGGGSFVITNLRVEGLDGGAGLSLEDGVSGVTVTNFQSEGKASRALILIDRAHDVVLIQPYFASAPGASFYESRSRAIPTYRQAGLWVTAQARNVHCIGGGSGPFHQAPVQPSYAVQIDAGARHVHLDHFSIADDPLANIFVDAGAVDARVNYRLTGYDRSLDFPGSRGNVFFDTFVQASGDLANCRNTSNQYFLCSAHLRLAPGNTLTTLPEGFQGQRLTIVFDGQVTVANTGNIRVATTSGIWNSVSNDCLDLLYSRGLWIEASRTQRT